MKKWVKAKSHKAYTYKEAGGEFAAAWQGLVDVATLRARGVCESGEGDENVLLDQWRRLGWSDEDDWHGLHGEWVQTTAD
jgi:hypothetical protein